MRGRERARLRDRDREREIKATESGKLDREKRE